jgi:hypothetical protein
MEPKSIKGSEHNEMETVCIRVNKIYDWVTRQVDVPLIVQGTINGTGNPFGTDAVCSVPNPVINCYLSDAAGNPISLNDIDCREIPQPGGVREEVSIMVDCHHIKLQKVKVAKQGFVTVQVLNPQTREILGSATLPWFVAEKFFLCAPPGTTLNCQITEFECDALLVCLTPPSGPPTFQELKISINMCQDIQMEALAKVEIEACPCVPRPELPVGCPPASFPLQCQDIFPK